MTASIDGKHLTGFVNKLELEYLDGFKPQATVSEPTRYALNMSSSFAFSIHCVTDSGYYAGQSATDSYSAADCRAKIQSFVRTIEAGINIDVSRALQRDVKSRPLYLYHNPQTYDSTRHNYCEACGSCGGAGTTTCHRCSNGYQSCSQCYSGYSRCNSCSGSGYRWENNRQVSCGSCSGGQIRCYNCSGSGRTTCNYCSGRGQTDCSPCHATGYFTHWMSAEARSRAEQSCQWHEHEAAGWINDYIYQSLSAQTHISINRAVPWNFAEGSYQLEHLPYGVQVTGTLAAMDADITIDGSSHKGLFLTPDTVEVWSLNHALDDSVANINNYVINNLNAETLKKYLHTKLASYALESVNKPSALPAPVTAPQLLSDAGFSNIKSTIINSAKRYDKVRGLISFGRWAKESIVCTGILLALLFGVNFLLPQGNNAGMGLATFFASLPAILEVFQQGLLNGLNLESLITVPVLVGLALLLMTLLGSGRAWSRFRLSYWFVLSAAIAVGLFIQFEAAFSQPLAANWWAAALIPDAVLCGILAGLMRARRYVFKNIGREVHKIECDTFARMLNYKE